MMYLRLILFSVIIFSFSCSKEENIIEDPKDDPKDETLSPVFEMEIDDIKWSADDFYYRKEEGLHVLFGTNLEYSIRWDIENITPEVPYILGRDENKLISSFYQYNSGKPQSFLVESGELIIEEFDMQKKILKGKFSFIASYQGNNLNITNGKIIIKDF